MINKFVTWFLLLLSCICKAGLVIAQDTIPLIVTSHQQKPGLYVNYKEVLKNQPSFESAFTIEQYYDTRELDDGTMHSEFLGFTFKTEDKSVRPGAILAFSDGKKLYVGTTVQEAFAEKRVFIPMDYVGRYSFLLKKYTPSGSFEYLHPTNSASLNLAFSVVPILDKILAREKDELFYFNDKGKLLKATPESIGFLLRHDKLLLESYAQEKKKTTIVLLRYLMKMNERHPLAN